MFFSNQSMAYVCVGSVLRPYFRSSYTVIKSDNLYIFIGDLCEIHFSLAWVHLDLAVQRSERIYARCWLCVFISVRYRRRSMNYSVDFVLCWWSPGSSCALEEDWWPVVVRWMLVLADSWTSVSHLCLLHTGRPFDALGGLLFALGVFDLAQVSGQVTVGGAARVAAM